jgi:hypothetical protein
MRALENKFRWKYFDLMKQMPGENSIMRSFIICTLPLMMLLLINREG